MNIHVYKFFTGFFTFLSNFLEVGQRVLSFVSLNIYIYEWKFTLERLYEMFKNTYITTSYQHYVPSV